MSSSIDWSDTIKKEARGSDDEDLGEVQEVTDQYVLVQRGIVNKEKFYIPRDQAESYDGDVLRFRIADDEVVKKYAGDSPPDFSNTGVDTERLEQERGEGNTGAGQTEGETTNPYRG